jgi:hypothetical protein
VSSRAAPGPREPGFKDEPASFFQVVHGFRDELDPSHTGHDPDEGGRDGYPSTPAHGPRVLFERAQNAVESITQAWQTVTIVVREPNAPSTNEFRKPRIGLKSACKQASVGL